MEKMNKNTVLSLHNINKSFDGKVKVSEDISFTLNKGEILSLLGPSGCGKTTLLRLIAGFERPDSGEITLYNRILSSSGTFVHAKDRHIGYVVQEGILFPHLNVYQNVAYGLGNGKGQLPLEQNRINSILHLMKIPELAQSMPHELSGGQQQRVALARALAPSPELILFDEPFSAMDSALRVELRAEIINILRETGQSAIIVTHDREEAIQCSDYIAILREGRLVQIDTPQNIYRYPVDISTAYSIGDVNILKGEYHSGKVITLLGEITVTSDGTYDGHHGKIILRPENITLNQINSVPSHRGVMVVLEKYQFKGMTSDVVISINGQYLDLTIINTTPLQVGEYYLLCIHSKGLFYTK
ncbi:ABC transporter ATP-binding protein [Proteus vulgaris]|jgi:iron(III) transport system ATP-binding protein|nr:ABC transporter ATP-binding protein [Proteus vulgaris]NBN47114.1 ATP-binding cassette domain-containing protein [Proteus sp. G2626]NBN86535.1 ATP-binding cassette domain-containing protein [Proteus sp. G2300]RNT28877.1 ABC transporter ATP-binding protein [Proteus mirabilis]MBG5969426.1 ABC transporter ATP-binding protein [Proteus vulgaris]